MTSILEPPGSLRLRALDPDLPMLAARAAMELDNYKSSGDATFEAVKQLSARLRNSFTTTPGTGSSPKTLLDSSTLSLVGRALNTSSWSGKVSTIDQLGKHIWDIASSLEKAASQAPTEPLDRIRDFCVALSECAASYRQAFHDLRPSHPFRR